LQCWSDPLGAVPIPATMLLTGRDISYRVQAAGIKAILTHADEAFKAAGFGGIMVLDDELETGLVKVAADFEPEPTLADDPGILYFTSGTTGPPTMVLHTQASYDLAHRVTGERWLCCNAHDVHWNLADNGWAKAAWSIEISLFGPWHAGSCIFAVDSRGRFEAVAALRTLARY
jgi:acyl-coenzyme A synthetase/AMP-(fatty) acid ligase